MISRSRDDKKLLESITLRPYWSHILALRNPSKSVSSEKLHNVEVNPYLLTWSQKKQAVVSEMAREQLEQLNQSFERVRKRSQIFFAVNLVLASAQFRESAVAYRAVTDEISLLNCLGLAFWVLAFVLVVAGMLGHAAAYSVAAELGHIDAIVASSSGIDEKEFEGKLLTERLEAVRTSTNTYYTRLSVSNTSVQMTVWGALVSVVGWVLTTV